MLSPPDPLVEPELVEELRALSQRYASAVDGRDRARFLAAFHEDAMLTVVRAADGPDAPRRTMRGHDEIGRVIEAIARYPSTFHFVGQSAYRRTRSEAEGEISCIAHHRWRDDVELDHVMYIRYADRYRAGTDDRWRIAERTVLVEWSETREVDVPGRTPR